MARQLLEDHGIQAIVTGQNASITYSIPAVKGPELQVMESHAQKAREILESKPQQEQ
jgi:hypothetical protein